MASPGLGSFHYKNIEYNIYGYIDKLACGGIRMQIQDLKQPHFISVFQ